MVEKSKCCLEEKKSRYFGAFDRMVVSGVPCEGWREAVVSFYALYRRTWMDALFLLSVQLVRQSQKAGCLLPCVETLRSFDRLLWTRQSGLFVPHGCEGEAFFEDHPLWLTTHTGDIPKHYALLLAPGTRAESPENYVKCGYLFEPEQQEDAHVFWKDLEKRGCPRLLLQETEQGAFLKRDTWYDTNTLKTSVS